MYVVDDDVVAMFAAGLYCYDGYRLISESRGTAIIDALLFSYYCIICIFSKIIRKMLCVC